MIAAIIPIVAVAISLLTLYLSQRNNDTTRKDSASHDWVDQLEKRVAMCESDRKDLRDSLERLDRELEVQRKENRDLLVQLVRSQQDAP